MGNSIAIRRRSRSRSNSVAKGLKPVLQPGAVSVLSPPPLSPKAAIPYRPLPLPDCPDYLEAQAAHVDGDLLLTLAEEVLFLILKNMDLISLGRLEQTSRFWARYLPHLEPIWMGALKWSDIAEQIQFTALTNTNLRFRELTHYKLKWRECGQCKKPFRERDIKLSSCCLHRGQWDLVHNGVGPSGVRWTCCHDNDKASLVCKYPSHHALKLEQIAPHDLQIYWAFRALVNTTLLNYIS